MENLSEKLKDLHDIRKFSRGRTWTKKGSSEKLKEKLYSHVDSLIKREIPEIGIIILERLPDGGYEITYFKKRD